MALPRRAGATAYGDGMKFNDFWALREGPVPGHARSNRVHDLGVLRVPSGRLEASDPFVNLGEANAYRIPAGDYPVAVTVADISDAQDGSHLREAYLSVVLGDAPIARTELLTPEGQEPAPDGEYYGVSVDAGTVGFADADVIARCMPPDDWYDGLFDTGRDDSWFELMDSPDHLIAGSANIVMPLATAGENVVLTHSGWGDGFYPVVGTYDAEGRLVGVHIDLLVYGAQDT